MTPIAVLARLSALVPPPRYPLVRYHGVLAPHAKRRSVVVPQVLESAACDRQDKASAITGVPKRPETKESKQTTQQKRRQGTTAEKARREERCEAAPAPASQRETRELSVEVLLTTSDGAAEHQRAPSSASTMLLQVEFEFVPESISVQHLERLLGGLLLATSPRVEWTKRLRRTYEIDVLACSRCGERMRLMAAITDKATARKILTHLGLLAEPMECRARDPTYAM